MPTTKPPLNLRYPALLRIIRFLYPISERFIPRLASRWAMSMFLTPVRRRTVPGEDAFHLFVKSFTFVAGGRVLRGYRTGSGPDIVCVHGWSGRAVQFRHIAQMLADSGYSVWMFDAPGHGRSPGSSVSMFDFMDAFKAVCARCQNLKAVIGHSLGAATVSCSIADGFRIPAFISISAPVVAADILYSFRESINGSSATDGFIRQMAIQRTGRTFDSLCMEHTFHEVKCPVLAIHGMDDRDAPHRHLNVLATIRPDITTLKIDQAGHRRTLKDQRSLQAIRNFVNQL